MVEENEQVENDRSTPPGTEQPRRRRAARRPAGPPILSHPELFQTQSSASDEAASDQLPADALGDGAPPRPDHPADSQDAAPHDAEFEESAADVEGAASPPEGSDSASADVHGAAQPDGLDVKHAASTAEPSGGGQGAGSDVVGQERAAVDVSHEPFTVGDGQADEPPPVADVVAGGQTAEGARDAEALVDGSPDEASDEAGTPDGPTHDAPYEGASADAAQPVEGAAEFPDGTEQAQAVAESVHARRSEEGSSGEEQPSDAAAEGESAEAGVADDAAGHATPEQATEDWSAEARVADDGAGHATADHASAERAPASDAMEQNPSLIETGTEEGDQAALSGIDLPAGSETAARASSRGDGAEEPRNRRNRRATRGVVTAAFSSVGEVAPPQPARPAERPAPALFQPPDLTVPRGDEEAAPTASTEPLAALTQTEAGPDTGAGQAVGSRRPRRATRAAGAPAHPDDELGREEQPALALTDEDGQTADGDEDEQPRRRRRRGGRRRKRPGQASDDTEQTTDEPAGQAQQPASTELSRETGQDDSSQEQPTKSATEPRDSTETDAGRPETRPADTEGEPADDEDPGSGRRRRRRRRRAGVSEEMEDLSADDPPNTVTKVRESRRSSDEVVGVRGSTRIEAKKQRRRDGREAGRRRAPILTEAEFLARRESVNRVMCVRQRADRTQIAVLEDGVLVEHYVNRAESSSMVGNVYLGKVQNVLPSMEAAFVDIGRGRNAVLYAGEVNWEAAGMEGQPKRIELALKSGDPVLVQVTKDPIGHKGARLTSQISLPGRFLVYVPEGSMTGISRKLPDTERARLKGILKDVVPEGAGVIVRTAAEGATEDQLTADVQRLTGEWADIQRKAKSTTPPTLLYGEPDLAIKVVRDIFNEDFTSLLVQGDATSRTLRDYIGRVAPDLLGRVQQWAEPDDLYTAHRIDEQLAKALDRKVWLPSGGSLVIDRTEAMTVIDVNTGKFTGQGGNLEETVTRNNLEAAEEIVRQLRLRDVGGIIVIDFIDMVLESNRDLVLRRLVECLGRDRTKHQVAEVTSLGLVQMTRKRIGQGLLEVFSTPCEVCGGRGHIVHSEPVGSGAAEDSARGRDRGNNNNRRGQRPAPPVNLGGKQTGKTPPPPKFDEFGHIDHSGDHPSEEFGPGESQETETIEPAAAAISVEPVHSTDLLADRESVQPESVQPEPVQPYPVQPEPVDVEYREVDPPGSVQDDHGEPEAEHPDPVEHYFPDRDMADPEPTAPDDADSTGQAPAGSEQAAVTEGITGSDAPDLSAEPGIGQEPSAAPAGPLNVDVESEEPGPRSEELAATPTESVSGDQDSEPEAPQPADAEAAEARWDEVQPAEQSTAAREHLDDLAPTHNHDAAELEDHANSTQAVV